MAGRYNTHFIAELEKESDRESPEEETAALIAAGIKSYRDAQVGVGPQAKGKESPWKIQGRLENLVSRL
jgi:hypothetical protein